MSARDPIDTSIDASPSAPAPVSRLTLTLPELATALGVSRKLIYRHSRAFGHVLGIPVLRLGRRRFVSRDAVERALSGPVINASSAMSMSERG